jgi:hypothetical protein
MWGEGMWGEGMWGEGMWGEREYIFILEKPETLQPYRNMIYICILYLQV